MGRAYYVNGQCLVSVQGSASAISGDFFELGLTDGKGRVTISPNYRHKDIKYDAFGEEVPPETLWMLTDVNITMTLVHFDANILNTCISESAGGGVAGTMEAAGTPMGAGLALFAAGNHYISLQLASPIQKSVWTFDACYLSHRPVVFPLGAERSLVQCNWRAIPYAPLVAGQELLSAGASVWTYQDTE